MMFGGQMGALVRDTDWSNTELGDYATWPQSLRSSLSLVLNAKNIAALYWGPEQWLLYNDAYGTALGDRHPWAFGRPFREALSDIAPVLGPQVQEVLATGQGFALENVQMTMHRDGKQEETFWTYSFSPSRVNQAASQVYCFSPPKRRGKLMPNAVLCRRVSSTRNRSTTCRALRPS